MHLNISWTSKCCPSICVCHLEPQPTPTLSLMNDRGEQD